MSGNFYLDGNTCIYLSKNKRHRTKLPEINNGVVILYDIDYEVFPWVVPTEIVDGNGNNTSLSIDTDGRKDLTHNRSR